MQGHIESFRVFEISLKKSMHLMDHRLGHIDGKGILLDRSFFSGIAKGKLSSKHVVINEIHMKGIGGTHTSPYACNEYQSPYLTGLLEFREVEGEGPIEGGFGKA